MRTPLPVKAKKAALIGGLVLCLGGGAATAAVVAGTAQAAGPPPLDHMLCYRAAATGFHIPPRVVLKNQFSPAGFVPKIGAVVMHCNPVVKILPTGQRFGVANPAAHLLCFAITAAAQPQRRVLVTNQFGRAPLLVGQPNLLCLPSWKSLTGPPNRKPVQPPGLDHFTCYPVTLPPGVSGFNPPPLQLRDQFAAVPVPAQVSPVPAELCVPTEKIVGSQVTAIVNPTMHLLCFPVTNTPRRPVVFDQNQFGTAAVQLGNTVALCVPSLKQLLQGRPR